MEVNPGQGCLFPALTPTPLSPILPNPQIFPPNPQGFSAVVVMTFEGRTTIRLHRGNRVEQEVELGARSLYSLFEEGFREATHSVGAPTGRRTVAVARLAPKTLIEDLEESL